MKHARILTADRSSSKPAAENQTEQLPAGTIQAAATQKLAPYGLRIADAAAYAGVSPWFIRSAIWVGKLRARRAGSVIVILRDDLDEFLKSLPEVEPNPAEWLAKRQQTATLAVR